MILPTMTPGEIWMALLKEAGWLSKRIDIIKIEDKKRKKKKGGNFKQYDKTFYFRNPQTHNRWMLMIRSYPKDFEINMMCLYESAEKRKGMGVIIFDVILKQLAVYTGHFFQRFRQRTQLDDSMSSLEVIEYFFRRPHFRYSVPQTKKDAERRAKKQDFNIIMNEDEGFCLGTSRFSNTFHVYKTYVTHEMLHEKQMKIGMNVLMNFKLYQKKAIHEKRPARELQKIAESIQAIEKTFDDPAVLVDELEELAEKEQERQEMQQKLFNLKLVDSEILNPKSKLNDQNLKYRLS